MTKSDLPGAGVIEGLLRTLRFTWPGLRRNRWGVAGGFLAILFGVVLQLLEPWPLKFVMDRIFSLESARPIGSIPALEALSPTALIGICAGAMAVIAMVRAATEYWSKVSFAVIGSRVLTDIRNDLYAHLLGLPPGFHHASRGGDLVVRLTGDMNRIRDAAATALLPLLANVLALAGMLVVMFVMNWRLALVGLVALPLFLLSAVRISRRIKEVARVQRKREGAMASTAAEAMGAIRTVQSFNLGNYFGSLFNTQSKKSFREGARGTRLSTLLERKVDVFIAVALALVLMMGSGYVLEGKLTPGDLLVFLTYMKRTLRPVKDFAKYTGRLAKAGASGDRVFGLLEIKPDIADEPGAEPAPPLRGTISLQQVSFGYKKGHPVLDGLNLAIDAGSRVAVVGPSGVGKSTLTNLLLRFDDPDAGAVCIDGTDIRRFTLASLREQIALVSQENLLFALSIRENIRLGRLDATEEEIEEAARLANAHGFIQRLPEGYDTVVSERGVSLSHGQRQRIAIARAVLVGAPILILDEPTTGLDEDSRKAVIRALDGLNLASTVILVTHDLLYASKSEWIFHLGHEGLLEQGTHEDLIARHGPYARLYGIQSSAHEDTDKIPEDGRYVAS